MTKHAATFGGRKLNQVKVDKRMFQKSYDTDDLATSELNLFNDLKEMYLGLEDDEELDEDEDATKESSEEDDSADGSDDDEEAGGPTRSVSKHQAELEERFGWQRFPRDIPR